MVTWMSTSNVFVQTASATTFLFGPFAACQQRKLRSLGSLRTRQNELRGEVNYLYQEQERLQRSLLRLDTNVAKMEHFEQELHRIAGNSHNVHRLVQVLQDQQDIYEQMKQCLRKKVLQNIVAALVQCDSDQNFAIGPREMEVLVVRLGMMDGVKFQERAFRTLITGNPSNPSLSQIMMLIRSLLQDDDNDTVFVLCPEELTGK